MKPTSVVKKLVPRRTHPCDVSQWVVDSLEIPFN